MPRADELYEAIEANDICKIKRLLEQDRDLVEAIDETPPQIHWAIYQDKRQMVELLLNHGADIERRDQDRDATPLDYAIVYGRKEIIPVLISCGANLDGKLQSAIKGASGGYEDFSELPSRHEYEGIAQLLRDFGSNN
ncbi:MAG: ankyrin repeat domain-containing protein [Gammaproteobacteria bacterium]|nr:ankyrin repeat domain-containing protein [Gammaproteobacteria bacterium]